MPSIVRIIPKIRLTFIAVLYIEDAKRLPCGEILNRVLFQFTTINTGKPFGCRLKKTAMKILSALALIIAFASCKGTGDRTHTMETEQQEAPTQDNNANHSAYDTSASHVQDSSTVINYDTAARKK
jgi:hypothetical protein